MSKANETSAVETPAKILKVPVNDDLLRRVYALMLKCRLVEERQGKDLAHSDAALAGALVELTPDDSIMLSTRGAFVENSVSPVVIPIDGSGSAQLAVAAGVALTAKLRNKQDVVVAFLDSTTLAFGASHEAMAFAVTQKLPLVVFVREETATANGDVLRKAEAHGIPGLSVDVNDAVAIFRVGKEAIHHARLGRGPSLIECRASDIDPVGHMERYLKKQGSWSEGLKRELSL